MYANIHIYIYTYIYIDRGTAVRPAAAHSVLLVVSHRLGAPEAAVGAKSGFCGEEQTGVRFGYFCAFAPSPTASAGTHNHRAICDPYISPGFCRFQIRMTPQCTLHTLPAAQAAICQPNHLGAFLRGPANLCACCSTPGMGDGYECSQKSGPWPQRSGRGRPWHFEGCAQKGLGEEHTYPAATVRNLPPRT